ncbi:Peroxidase 5 [Dichanthelium oligosanthes]|uniref:Peroxidase n=1 Tax=Dichanthelium oligosanthes TaxID=888268 RepID=A0A1E5WC45_9POAL|nr:Peroxidase 5 [Dichanthelium oligosanthes]
MAWFSLVFLAVFIAGASSWHVVVDAEIIDGLQLGFYDKTCPDAESTVGDIVRTDLTNDPTLAAGIIRIFFHDCFVKGCDASILLDDTPTPEEETEKDSPANGFTLNGLSTIDTAKSTIESLCPRTVSCADIIAFAAREAAIAAGHPGYTVAAGRRDGLTSLKSNVPGNLPGPSSTVANLTKVFVGKGMSQEDMVVLSGAHSIGGAHCFMFSNRLYNFSEGADMDPAMNTHYARQLRNVCPAPGRSNDDPENAPKVAFDARTEQRLDSSYYMELLAGRGLLSSDNALVEDPETRPLVEQLATDEFLFHRKFREAMQKLGTVDVLVGEGQGEIRLSCSAVNTPGEEVLPTIPSLF